MLFDKCYSRPITKYLLTETGYLILATSYFLPETCYLILATSYLLPETCYLILVSSYLFPYTYFLINVIQQAGAELGQAQLKPGFSENLVG